MSNFKEIEMGFGHRNAAARKLNSEEVAKLRKAYGEGETQGSLSRRFGVSVGQIGRIVRGESWQGSFASPPTQDEIITRLMETQAIMRGGPVSPLDGGDLPPEESGLSELQLRAAEFGLKK